MIGNISDYFYIYFPWQLWIDVTKYFPYIVVCSTIGVASKPADASKSSIMAGMTSVRGTPLNTAKAATKAPRRKGNYVW